MNTFETAAVVLGMYETGLGVARSLGRNGITVIGVDHAANVGFHSRYVTPMRCPHPIEREDQFIQFLISLSQKRKKLALFITADEFLGVVSRKAHELNDYFLFNIPSGRLIEVLGDKYSQATLAQDAGIPVPRTIVIRRAEEIAHLHDIQFPVFVKGSDVNVWRRYIGTHVKGFVAGNEDELSKHLLTIVNAGSGAVVQELIPGPDSKHFKVSCYIDRSGKALLAFVLQKLRQMPIRFGYGCIVKSVHYPELLTLGLNLYQRIDYRGVGSAEFKLDERDGRLKLIEINARYWQQNGLAERCGMNFPLFNYLDLTGQALPELTSYEADVKWVNIYHDIAAFLAYRRQGELSFRDWLISLKGPKTFSDYAWDDPMPGIRQTMLANPLRAIMKLPARLAMAPGSMAIDR